MEASQIQENIEKAKSMVAETPSPDGVLPAIYLLLLVIAQNEADKAAAADTARNGLLT